MSIWRESENQPNLNPVVDEIILLRRFVGPGLEGVVRDEETAVHLALQAMIPVVGRDHVSKFLPYKARFQTEKKNYDERVWRVEGTLHCADDKQHCVGGVLSAEINRYSGEVVHVFSGD